RGAWGTSPTPQRPAAHASSTPNLSTPQLPTTASRPTIASDSEAFPALPTAPKPNTLMAGLTRGAVRWQGPPRGGASSAATNPWGSAPASTTTSDTEAGTDGISKK